MYTLADIHKQAAQLALLPPPGKHNSLEQGLGLLQQWLQNPPEGMRVGWPASRRWGALGYDRADDSAFYPANLAYLLQRLTPHLPLTLAQQAAEMVEGITSQYGLYQSVPGLDSYAFYQTRPVKRWFPHGRFFWHDEHFRPPDDPDDTALIYLTKAHTQAQQHWLRHTKLPAHAGLVAGPVPHTLPQWQKKAAYTTFFSANMPLGYDVAVQANIMNWVLHQPGELTAHDTHTLAILSDTIVQELYLADAYTIAPYYAHPVGIAYTLARFLAAHPNHAFAHKHRPVLLQGLQKLEHMQNISGFERLVVQNAQLMLGQAVGPVPQYSAAQAASFALYRFPLAAEYPYWLARRLTALGLLQVRFSSPAFALGLLLQRHVLGQKVGAAPCV